jgi:tetratricopeptide (TPR) repeat protein
VRVRVGYAIILLPLTAWAAGPRMSSTCAEDDAVPTPPDYLGWDRSSLVAWEAVEQYGGIVPDIEEDRSHAPPAWWRYPSALRSGDLLAAEARNGKGLYEAVTSGELKPGDLVVRTTGAGACGKMAMVAGILHDQWMTLEADGDKSATRAANPMFFDGKALRPEARAYRIRVKKDDTLGHVRELERDLEHLERTVAERPPLIARNGRATVDEKVHDLLDEAWSLMADPAFDLERRELGGRALALAAALDWPGAAEEAAAVLDDLIRRAPSRASPVVARASALLVAGEADKAVTLAEAATAIPGAPARAQYVLGRALLSSGKREQGLASLRRFLDEDPLDPRARQLVASGGREPALEPPQPRDPSLRWSGTADRGGVTSSAYGFHVEWPITWRVVAQSDTPEGVLIDLATGRVLLPSGEAERAAATVLAQRPDSAAARAALVKKAGRNVFPDAKLKALPPLVPGSHRELFRERKQGESHEGEVTTLEHGGVVYFLVLNATDASYAKLKDEYATFVKSVTFPKPE